ncbi:hypothetical protein NDU88_006571 [Pleurodeles waltl]|uniref:Uncharacterized protein n=1 Tax=Pleurodeles waltl TaxID=8319 RepID=A0AAV7X452_PLEWA|nr:hypothetical protein NDU88_006571 [Pleurodeles waltl]
MQSRHESSAGAEVCKRTDAPVKSVLNRLNRTRKSGFLEGRTKIKEGLLRQPYWGYDKLYGTQRSGLKRWRSTNMKKGL